MYRTPRAPLALLTLALVLPTTVFAQTPEDTGEATEAIENPTIDDLAWIAGTWATDLADQALEERWSPPMANAMTGSFRWARDGEVWLYEFLLIEATDNGIFYYLRHFGPGSVGWEDRDAPLAYRLSALTQGRAEFTSVDAAADSFVFTRDDDELTIEIISAEDTKRFVYSLQTDTAATGAAEVGAPDVDEPAAIDADDDDEAVADTATE